MATKHCHSVDRHPVDLVDLDEATPRVRYLPESGQLVHVV